MEKLYVIIGSNNFWYATFRASTQSEIDGWVKEVKMNCGENEETYPDELYLYEVNEVTTIKL